MRHAHQTRNGSALSRYLTEIRNYPVLSKEQEIQIGRSISEGMPDGQHDLVLSNLGFVVKIASEYQNMGLPFEDLLNEGNIGLLHAASRYDHTKSIKFITYASWWVRKSILKALAEQAAMIRVPSYQRKKVARQRAKTEALRARHRHVAGDPHCEACDREIPSAPRFRSVSLDEATRPDGHARLIEILVDYHSENPELAIIQKESLARLKVSLTCLNEKEHAVISRRFGLAGGRNLTLKEIGHSLGLSRERVRQIEMSARHKLKSQLHRARSHEGGTQAAPRPAGRRRRATA